MDLPSYLSGAVYMKSYRVLRANVVACLEKYGLTPTSWVLLGVIAESQDGVRLVTVAERLNVKASLITTIAHDLSAKGLIARAPHKTDKRAKLLVLTGSGKVFMKTVEKDVNDSLKRLLDGVTVKDLQAYKKVLDTIIHNSSL